MPILADVAIMPMTFNTGCLSGVLLLLVVALAEGIVLRVMKWGTFKRSIIDAGLANIGSTLPGIVFSLAWFFSDFQCTMVPVAQHYMKQCDWIISPILSLVIMWALSVLIEGAILLRLKRHPAHQTWKTSLVANTASYILLAPVYLIAYYG
jgi:hypothetical protein